MFLRADWGSAQKQVRYRPIRTQNRVRRGQVRDADKLFAYPILRGQHPFGRKNACHIDGPRGFGAETGTLWCFPAVENPVGSVTYPRRIRFGDCAETGSVCRRFGFGRSQNQVRLLAETGTSRVKFSFVIRARVTPYTVYE